jgi:hypothetical protein
MDRGLCIFCHLEPVTGRKRKYCDLHSKLASTLWKRQHRRLWKAAGEKYWDADWKGRTPDERRAYFRTYMRVYRERRAASALEPQSQVLERRTTPDGPRAI